MTISIFLVFSLHQAVKRNDIEIIELILKHGAYVNVAGSDGHTPLHHCVRAANKDVAKLLLAYGSDIKAKNIFKKNPIEWAEAMKKNAFAQFLREITKTQLPNKAIQEIP